MATSLAPFPNTTRPLTDNAFAAGETHLRTFIQEQLADYGADMEIAPGRWALFAVGASDQDADFIARAVLESATFPWKAGSSDDDAWTIFYIETAHQATARHWLDHLHRWLEGQPLLPSPTQLAELGNLLESAMPHRVARNLVDAGGRGELPPAPLRDPSLIRALLDRLHRQEPTFLAAVLLLVEHHLIDLLELYRILEPEDVDILNDLTQGNLSSDPFLLNRQSAAAGLRRQLIELKILNPLDQRKHTEASNPYAQLTRLRRQTDGRVLLRIDGLDQSVEAASFRDSLNKIRQRENRGIDSLAPDSRTPWATDERAYHLRHIRQLCAEHPRLRAADILHMIERALAD